MLRSIRWTLQLWHAGILALALMVLGGAFDVGLRRVQMRRVDAELEGAARVLAAGPMAFITSRQEMSKRPPPPFPADFSPELPDLEAAPVTTGGQTEARARAPVSPMEVWSEIPRNALHRFGESEQDQPYFVIWESDGRVLRSSSPDLKAPEVADLPTVAAPLTTLSPPRFRQHGEFREVIVPGLFGIRVMVGKSLRAENATVDSLRLQLLGTGLAVLAVGLCGGWILSKRIVRPIKIISDTAKAISGSDLSRRIGVTDESSELGSLTQTLNETFSRLETAFARQVQFTADASHELRTPLAVIHSHAELALSRPRSEPEYRQAIETTLKAARRMHSLVESLLALARSDAHKLRLKFERFDLRQIAEECVAQAVPHAREKNVAIETRLQSLEIESDRTHISQVLTNLLTNAIQYNRLDGRIMVTIAREGTEAIIQIDDTGVGIAAEDRSRVFERFFRADRARSHARGGVGLGLAICQGLVTALGGRISFESRLGEGTTFSIRLPLVPLPAAKH